MLEKFILCGDYLYRAPLPIEQLPRSDPCKIAVYKDNMDKGMKFSLASVLGFVPLATDDDGPSSPGRTNRRKSEIKAKGKAGKKNTLVAADRHMEDDHINLTRCRRMVTILLEILFFPISIFSPLMLGKIWRLCRAVFFSHMSEGLLKRKIEDVEKVLAVYNRKVLALHDSIVKACKCMVTDLEVVEDEKSKEVHHLKKKNSSLKKSCEASKARVKEQKDVMITFVIIFDLLFSRST
ncbi:hypothetical protein Fot_19605 [Forsythia ovata]|uniref:Uncharacterized protein n=1 Tax=Forsythia ovata TaxID=205694 RepID=A0ABD1VLI1_9LAMI